jgi:hypothetical protein
MEPRSGTRRIDLRRLDPRRDDLPVAPLLITAVYVLIVLVTLSRLVHVIYLHADAASAPVLGDLLDNAPSDRVVVLGNYPWYESLGFMQATRSLPGHRLLWEAAPIVFALAGFAGILWAAGRTFGRWATGITAALLFCIPAQVMYVLFSLNFHGQSVVHAALLGTLLVFLTLRGGTLPRAWHVALCVLAGIFTGIGLGSDNLLVVSGLIPFLGAAAAVWWVSPTRRHGAMFGSAVGIVVVAEIVSRLLVRAEKHDKIFQKRYHLHFSNITDAFPHNFTGLFDSLTFLGNADYSGNDVDPVGVMRFTAAVLLVLVLALAVRWSWRFAMRLPDMRRGVDEPGSAARVAYGAFWGLTLVGVATSYVVTAAYQDKFTARYLVSLYVAMAALVPLLGWQAWTARAAIGTWSPRLRAVTATGVTVFVALVVAAALRGEPTSNPSHFPTGKDVAALQRFAEQQGVKIGYASYWDAPAITWQTKGKLTLYPVWECTAPAKQMCRFNLHVMSNWYTPRTATKTMLVIDPTQPLLGFPPDQALGTWTATAKFGQLTAYVFSYDIASHIARG